MLRFDESTAPCCWACTVPSRAKGRPAAEVEAWSLVFNAERATLRKASLPQLENAANPQTFDMIQRPPGGRPPIVPAKTESKPSFIQESTS